MRAATNYRLGSLSALARLYFRRRYAILFYSLLFTMVIVPLSGVLGIEAGLTELFLAANLLIAVIPFRTETSRGSLLTILIILWIGRLATSWLDHPLLSAVMLGSWTLVGLLAAASALRFAMSAIQVDAEHLYAALSAYLLAGIFFGLFYWVLEQIRVGTFATPGEFTRMSAIYFSFVTLATLGYGDIVPRTEVARGLAIIEGVGGQLFLAVLVARLVSLYGRGKEAI